MPKINRADVWTERKFLEEQDSKKKQLRAALIVGEQSGFVEYSYQEFMNSLEE